MATSRTRTNPVQPDGLNDAVIFKSRKASLPCQFVRNQK